jgi:hypothetical protein
MEHKTWIDVKSPRFFYLEGYTRCWGDGIWCKNFDTSNKAIISTAKKYLRYLGSVVETLNYR